MEKNIQSAREVIGQFIEERRTELGLTIYQLTKATGLQRRQVKAVLSGEKSYTIDSLLKLSTPLKLYIFFGEKEGKNDVPLDDDHMLKELGRNDPNL